MSKFAVNILKDVKPVKSQVINLEPETKAC